MIINESFASCGKPTEATTIKSKSTGKQRIRGHNSMISIALRGVQRPAAFVIVCFCFCAFRTVSYSESGASRSLTSRKACWSLGRFLITHDFQESLVEVINVTRLYRNIPKPSIYRWHVPAPSICYASVPQ